MWVGVGLVGKGVGGRSADPGIESNTPGRLLLGIYVSRPPNKGTITTQLG